MSDEWRRAIPMPLPEENQQVEWDYGNGKVERGTFSKSWFHYENGTASCHYSNVRGWRPLPHPKAELPEFVKAQVVDERFGDKGFVYVRDLLAMFDTTKIPHLAVVEKPPEEDELPKYKEHLRALAEELNAKLKELNAVRAQLKAEREHVKSRLMICGENVAKWAATVNAPATQLVIDDWEKAKHEYRALTQSSDAQETQ